MQRALLQFSEPTPAAELCAQQPFLETPLQLLQGQSYRNKSGEGLRRRDETNERGTGSCVLHRLLRLACLS